MRGLSLVPLLVLGTLTACKPEDGARAGTSGGPGAPTDLRGGAQRRELPRVRTATVERREMTQVLSTTTAIESERQIEVFPRIAGIVTEIRTEEGRRVAEGDVLAQLDDRAARAALEEAEVALVEAQAAVPRLEVAVQEQEEALARAELTAEGARLDVERNERGGRISKNELEKLKLAHQQALRDLASAKLGLLKAQKELEASGSSIDQARLAVERAELELSFTQITAPFDGVIALRSIEVGDSASSTTACFVLTDPDHVKAVIYRPQRELAFYRGAAEEAGQIEIHALPDALPGERYEGHVRIVSPTIDATSGSVRLTIDLDQPAVGDARPRMLPGMLVRLEIVTDRHPDALVVPKRAVQREGDRRHLFVVRDGHVVRVDVEEGFPGDRELEVLPIEPGSLREGDAVVVVGNRDLSDGQEVQVEDGRTGGTDPTAAGGAVASAKGDGDESTEGDVTAAGTDAEDDDAAAAPAGETVGADDSGTTTGADQEG